MTFPPRPSAALCLGPEPTPAERRALHLVGWQPGEPIPFAVPVSWGSEDDADCPVSHVLDTWYRLVGSAHRERYSPVPRELSELERTGLLRTVLRWLHSDEGPRGVYRDGWTGWDSLDPDAMAARVLHRYVLYGGHVLWP